MATAAQFREIHKNTWLKRLTADGKKITVGPKKSERSWVVFCVHDDTEAVLEGYAEPRQAASHNPEWFVSMQNTQHISHALIPNSNEFEFVVTLSNEIIRFHAMSWEIMQEWVDTLRSKLREMKILSPRENLYTKLPEARPPLLPTRDPTSPLPAPPPVPAAIVPGVEIVVPQSMLQATTTNSIDNTITRNENPAPTTATATAAADIPTTTTTITTTATTISTTAVITTTSSTSSSNASAITTQPSTTSTAHISSMSNTLSQNLLNLLTDPINTYSEQLQASVNFKGSSNDITDVIVNEISSTSLNGFAAVGSRNVEENEDCLSPLLRPASRTESQNDAAAAVKSKRHSVDHARNMENVLQSDRQSSRLHSSRSHSVGAADKFKSTSQYLMAPTTAVTTAPTEAINNKASSAKPCDTNITALEINDKKTTKSDIAPSMLMKKVTTTNATTNDEDDEENLKTNITIIQVSTDNNDCDEQVPILPHKSAGVGGATTESAAEIFQFPETIGSTKSKIIAKSKTTKTKQTGEYKSNVQLIPSNNKLNSSTIKVLGDVTLSSQYSRPAKKLLDHHHHHQPSQQQQPKNTITTSESNQVTTVHVGGTNERTTASVSVYGTCYTPPPHASSSSSSSSPISTPKLPKKIILSANSSGITNITVDNNAPPPTVHSKHKVKSKNSDNNSDVFLRCNTGNVHYEKVFLSSSTPTVSSTTCSTAVSTQTTAIATATLAVNSYVSSPTTKILHKPKGCVSPNRHEAHISSATDEPSQTSQHPPSVPTSAITTRSDKSVQTSIPTPTCNNPIEDTIAPPPTRIGGSPALQRRAAPLRSAHMLKRGQTEAVITTRPSRRDFYFNNSANAQKTQNLLQQSNRASNKSHVNVAVAVNNNENDINDQRRRSSSTSDARAAVVQRSSRGTNNNEFSAGGGNRMPTAALRIQQPPQPYRSLENSLIGIGCVPVACMSPPPLGASASKRMTLREQQVMQLRREIMHPGGVRLQLRRKDCMGSIAWIDAFGAVWVAGWKQKEHPVLYNALHIGDQLLSIAGVTINTAADANKIIRNANTLFVEVLIRRMPFGRGYAIRRDREGQCLGLIRDGNTSTIVDVVPNSLAARHGLPPKAQSCDGTTLTFWVLTEINGRPLNLFFKENEIRDRLNSVGRDISILVQPSDLITKLKKQLKSLRGYKDYLVQ